MTRAHDVAVIGCGAGGYKAAITAAQHGARVVVIEREQVGGACLNRACVPKKALAHIASLILQTQTLTGHGLTGRVSGDLAAAIAFKNQVVDELRRGLPLRLKPLAVETIIGEARMAGPNHILVETAEGKRRIEARSIIIATGAAPRALAGCAVDHDRIVNADSFIPTLAAPLGDVLCVGGGALGVEAAFFLHQFGGRVTIVEEKGRLLDLPAIPERASNLLERSLTSLGVTVCTQQTVRSARATHEGVCVEFADGRVSSFARVLVAVGRQPRPDDLGLDDLGIERDANGFIVTNEFLQTNIPGLFAVGDVKGGPMTAAAALHDGRVAGENATQGAVRQRNYHQVPLVVDSVLPIAAMGLSEELAESAGFTPDTVYIPLRASVKARAYNDATGFIEIVHDQETGQMLGGCIVGAGADELIHIIALACRSKRGLWSLTDLDYGHPSWSEDVGTALEPYIRTLTQTADTVFRPGIYAAD
ncbi:MAG: NAD(P)/FAD-dependent oxidoreductase [Gammaproteobacteria bacterium]|nr:NAD(P)/FAD-dependent oxidoreductase [Gammaproteobacteria bacterium]